MFQSPKKRMRALLAVVDDMLAGAPEPAAPPHPHRRPASVRLERRDGAVAARPMHCVCPVRATTIAAPAGDVTASGSR